jgi:hypothetical protein
MPKLCESFVQLQRGEIDSASFERCLLDSILYFPCWDAPEQPQRSGRTTAVGERFDPLIVTRDDMPIMPAFDDSEMIKPWLERRGNTDLANQLTFVTMHGGPLISSMDDRVHLLLVLSNGNMIEIDRSQLARLRNGGAA